MTETLQSPYPYFGGKRRAAAIAWRALGNCPNYVEPFFGSGAVLLARPHEPKIETINDLDCAVPNFWRAVQHDPDAVAEWCSWPISEVDLHARHRWLVARKADLREKMIADPDFYDAKFAGWWVWGISMWIGSGWCKDARTSEQRKRPEAGASNSGKGVHARGLPAGKTPIIDNVGVGVHKLSVQKPLINHCNGGGVHSKDLSRKIPDLYTRGFGRGIRSAAPERGLSEQIPDLQGQRRGVRMPNLASERGVHGAESPPCLEWFRALSDRLRRVRVICGDWSRVVTDSVIGTTKSRNSGMNPCGIFLDPPYPEGRTPELYSHDDLQLAAKVAAWASEKGDDPDVRIVLAGYEDSYDMPADWRCIAWKALRGYGGAENENRHRERLWLSPHCRDVNAEDAQRGLFA
jgi:hypothetical protein